MTFTVDVNQPGSHDRAVLSDEHAASSYGIPVLVWKGEAYGVADLPSDIKLVAHWRKARTGPVWALIMKALVAGYPIEIDLG